MSEIYRLLDAIRERPRMYIGDGSLTNLWYLLQGYQMALLEHKDMLEHGPWGWKFHHFVASRFPEVSSGFNKGYCNVILEHTGGDEQKALALFFGLVDEFRLKEQEEK